MYPQQYPVAPQYPAAPVNPYANPYATTSPHAPAVYGGPQQYPPATPPAPAQTPAQGSLDQFYSQPSSGNKAWSFHNKPVGTTYAGIVARPVTNADIQQQTALDGSGAPRFYRDGRPMFVMVVPLLVQPSAEFPEGQASWYVRGQSRDELVRAMAEAGAPEGPPEAGATITVTLVGQRPSRPGFNPAHIYRVTYQRPAGAAPVAPPVQSAPPAQAPAAPPAAPPAPPAVQAPAAAPALGNLSPEQQALLAKLTGG